ncbi:MAG: hypothetical protein O2888_03260, partial [Chloroflexi bacterium]|nr:hypothetical protein [Chloroflexota bacterium]
LVIPEGETEKWTGFMAWAAQHGIAGMVASADSGEAPSAADLPARIDSPAANSTVGGQVAIQGRATSDNFVQYRLDWGIGANPTSWARINSGDRPVTNGILGQWDTTFLASGIYSLRLIVDDEQLGARRYQIPVRVDNGDLGPGEDFTPQVSISAPSSGGLVAGSVPIVGTAASVSLIATRVEFGAGTDPVAWSPIGVRTDPVVNEQLAVWSTANVPDGPYTLRVTVDDEVFGSVSTQVLVIVRNAEPEE